MIDDTNAAPEEVIAEEVQAEEVPASLTVQDLAQIRNIIDVASQRGAFKPAEFAVVGETYNKLAAFIAAITPPAPEGEAAEAPAEDDSKATEVAE